ncbi:SepM family pheromone-processing serine protease [Brevibacillus sp. SYSU BS000544]|uniref:SepM family pheromone-processing serine protease n=1 Tax=Brevibacillus sp. SYSU BS000544 TaxID=3416443 RepID=UPI003CE4534D
MNQTVEHRSDSMKKRLRWSFVALIVTLVCLFYIPLPYYITRPGSAIELSPIIQVEDGTKDEKGTFMLTTVRMGEAKLLWYLYSKISPDVELIDKNLVLSHGESDEDFTQRELEVMRNSQKLAEAVAFKRAGYPVNIENHGVLVMGTIAGMPAKEVLKVGDVITKVDQTKLITTQELLDYLKQKKPGDTITVTYNRNGKENSGTITLKALPDESGHATSRVGLGIRPENKQVIEIPKKVTISAEGIGGPSAGLMMSLEIYEQLEKKTDITKGYRIAGTGTISADGTVGRIGGINHKIIAADKAGAEIFFAPDEATTGDVVSNYQEAVETAKRIGTKMIVVPVKTFDDAITYLTNLKAKQS